MASNHEIRVRFLAGPRFQLKYLRNAGPLLFGGMLLVAAVALAAEPPAVQAIDERAALARRALAFLAGQAQSDDAEVRAAVAAAWGRIGSPGGVPMARAAAKDKVDRVRIEAAGSLDKLATLDAAAILEEIIGRKAPEPKGKPTAADELKRAARAKVRAEAVLRLADLGGEKTVVLLEKLLKDPDAAVSDAAAIGLCRMGLEEEGKFADRFLNALEDGDEFQRAAAVKALGLTRAPVALEAVKEKAADTSEAPAVRAEAMTALSAFPPKESVPVLEAGSRDADPRVRLMAVRALTELDPSGITALREAFAGKDAAVQLTALKGLVVLGEKADLTLAHRALASRDADARRLALETLAAAGDAVSPEVIARVMDDDAEPRLKVEAAVLLILRARAPKPAAPPAASTAPASALPGVSL